MPSDIGISRQTDSLKTSSTRKAGRLRVLRLSMAILPLLLATLWMTRALAADPGAGARITRVTASATDRVKHEGNTLDGNLTTAWSVRGDGQWICYQLDQVAEIRGVAVAWAAGEERNYRFEVLLSKDGDQWNQVFAGVSGGETNELEAYRFEPAQARFVKIVGHGSDVNDWVNITQVTIGGAEYVPPLSVEMKRFQAPQDAGQEPPAIYAVTASPSSRASLPHNTVDGDHATGWSAQEDGQWLTFHLSRPAEIASVAVTWACPHEVPFEIRVSRDGRRWQQVLAGSSRGDQAATEEYQFHPVAARYVRLAVFGSQQNHWHRLAEVKIGQLPYRPSPEMQWWSRRWESGPASDQVLAQHVPVPWQSYSDMAASCVRTLIENGTDRYGRVQAPIWVLNLDLDSMNCFPRYNDALIERAAISSYYSPTAPYGLGHRAIRGSQRESGCSNLLIDQPMIRAALLQDLLSGSKRFTPAVKAYVRWYFGNLMDKDTGLMQWGVHNSYDVFEDRVKHSDGDHPEILGLLLCGRCSTKSIRRRRPDISSGSGTGTPIPTRAWSTDTPPAAGDSISPWPPAR